MWNEGPVPPELTGFPGYLLARLGEASRARMARALAPAGLHPRDFGVMNILAAQPGITQQRLAEHAAIDVSTMVGVLDELEAKGLAERRTNPADRRARALYLTPAGKETLARLRKTAAGLQSEFFGTLSTAELRTLHELLRRLAAANIGGSRETPGAANRT